MKKELILEAALFSAGRPLDVIEIQDATGMRKDEVRAAAKKLVKRYKKDDTSLEVVRIGPKYAMQLKTDYGEHARKLAQAEIPQKLLKTLVLIAYHQPLKQSTLRDMIGDKVYDHVRELHELKLVRRVREGRTKLLYTTKRFQDYFGIDATKKDAVKEYLAKQVGLPEVLKDLEASRESAVMAADGQTKLPLQEEDGARDGGPAADGGAAVEAARTGEKAGVRSEAVSGKDGAAEGAGEVEAGSGDDAAMQKNHAEGGTWPKDAVSKALPDGQKPHNE